MICHAANTLFQVSKIINKLAKKGANARQNKNASDDPANTMEINIIEREATIRLIFVEYTGRKIQSDDEYISSINTCESSGRNR